MSVRTLGAYHHAVGALIADWSSENLLRPSRNAGVLWVRELEGRKPVKGTNDTMTPATVRVYLAGAKALYAALRWSGATDAAPFADVKVAIDKTPSWEKREAYTNTAVTWLERCSEGATLLIVLLGAHAGLRVSEMTALKWDDVNLSEGVLRVVAGKGGKTARVYLTPTLVQALEATPLEQRTGYVLPCRSRQVVYGRLASACRQAKVTFKGVHALRHASGRGHGCVKKRATWRWWPITCGTRAWTRRAATPRPTTDSSNGRWESGRVAPPWLETRGAQKDFRRRNRYTS